MGCVCVGSVLLGTEERRECAVPCAPCARHGRGYPGSWGCDGQVLEWKWNRRAQEWGRGREKEGSLRFQSHSASSCAVGARAGREPALSEQSWWS